MAPGVAPISSGDPPLADGPALSGVAWMNPRPLAIDSASYYAREHGLALDFYTESSKRAAVHLVTLKEDLRYGKARILTSYSHLTQCTIPTPDIDDCWTDTESAVQYLRQLPSALGDLFSEGVHISDLRCLTRKILRCEVPILRSDNNLDLLGLARDIYERRAIPSAEIEIPLIETDASGDEGLRFPCWSDQLMKHFEKHLFKEGIQNQEVSQFYEGLGLCGGASVNKPDKEAICRLIDAEFMAYKQRRVMHSTLSEAQYY